MAPGEQLAYLFNMEKVPLFTSLSIAGQCAGDSKASAASAEWVLNCKATGAESLAEQMQLARQSSDPEVKETVRQLAAVREQMAHSVLDPLSGGGSQSQADSWALYRKQQDLARKLGLQTGGASRDGVWLGLDEVRKAIPRHAVLIEVLRFPTIDFDAKSTPHKQRPWKRARYAAWAIPPFGAGEVTMIDLGDAAAIDSAVAKSRLAVLAYPQAVARLGARKAAELVDQYTAQLAELAYKPLVPAIGRASTLYLSLDGGLWLFPWEALSVGDGQFLVEQKRINYLATGRSLLVDAPSAAAAKPAAGSDAVLFADPDYDAKPSGAASETMNDWLAYAQRPLGSSAGAGLLDGATFQRLTGESDLVKSLAGSLKDYLKSPLIVYQGGEEALENTFKTLHGPRVLIVSTHGYFLRDQLFDRLPETAAGRSASAALNRARLFGLADMPLVPEPLLRCGLAMAGANHHYLSHDANDGILTAWKSSARTCTGPTWLCSMPARRELAPFATAREPPACTRHFSWLAPEPSSPACGGFRRFHPIAFWRASLPILLGANQFPASLRKLPSWLPQSPI